MKYLASIALLSLLMGQAAWAQTENESKLWYGPDDAGIEIISRTGKNLAFTEDDPKVHPEMTQQARKMDQALIKIGERCYMAFGWGITSPMMVVGDDGLIIIDPPESLEMGKATMKAFNTVSTLPVKAIVYTHNHFDHVAAVKAFTTSADVASGKVDIYAHEKLMEGVVNWASTVGAIEGRRTSYTAAIFLEKGPDGSVHDALGPDAQVGTVTFIPPTKTFRDELDVTISGIEMHLQYVPSETNDEIIAWFPELRVLNSAEVIQGESFPNLYTIRGTKYRDPVQWYQSIDLLRRYPAEFLVPSHGRPIAGQPNIQEMLTAYRDAIQFVHDQTIRYMNKGYTPDQLVEVVVLPKHLSEHPWLGQHYGTVKHAVRNIYNGYLGWFQGDPWALDPLPNMERAKRYVELMGGRDKVLAASRKAIDDEEFTWAAEILSYLIRMDPDDMEARNIKAEAYRLFAYTLTNINWRNWSLTAAAELEGKEDLSGGFAFTSPDVIQTFPIDVLLRMLATRINPEKSADVHLTLGVQFTDVKQGCGLEIRGGIVQVHNSVPRNSNMVILAKRSFLNRVLVGDIEISGEMANALAKGTPAGIAAILDAIDTDQIKLKGGDSEDVREFFSYFDPPADPGSIDLIVR